jgi:hypothetical protein
MLAQQLMCNSTAQYAAILERMVKVESRTDTRPKYFTEQVVGVLKDVGVNSLFERETVHHDVHVGGAEIALDQLRNRAGHAGVCCRVLRMVGSGPERQPIHVTSQLWVSTASLNRCDWSPKTVVVFAVKASNGGIGKTSPENGHKPGAF